MQKIKFYKYHGTGNDFILIDNIKGKISGITKEQIAYLCNRHLGIGADGLMFLNKSEKYDFEMDYYNSDGSGATMCGNGGRCIVAFAKKLGIITDKALFTASDGLHKAFIDDKNIVKLKMADVANVDTILKDYFCNTGSPHYVKFINDVNNFDVYNNGKKIRYSDKYKATGTNVNFVEQLKNNEIFVRTYERGVEEETLSCGTGVVASALTFFKTNNLKSGICKVKTLGGNLTVTADRVGEGYSQIWLEGKATFVFYGEIILE